MMKMLDDGFEDKVKDRMKHKHKTLADKGCIRHWAKREKPQKKTDRLGGIIGSYILIEFKSKHNLLLFEWWF